MPPVLVCPRRADLGGGDGEPAFEVGEDPGLGGTVLSGGGREQLQDVFVTDGVDGLGAPFVARQREAGEAEPGAEVVRSPPHDRFVGDHGVPLFVGFHKGQHGSHPRARAGGPQREFGALACRRRVPPRVLTCAAPSGSDHSWPRRATQGL